jgi:hypothetical protein
VVQVERRVLGRAVRRPWRKRRRFAVSALV